MPVMSGLPPGNAVPIRSRAARPPGRRSAGTRSTAPRRRLSATTTAGHTGLSVTGTDELVKTPSPSTGPSTSASSQPDTADPTAPTTSSGRASVRPSASACDLGMPSAASLVIILARLRADPASANSTASALSTAAAIAPLTYSDSDRCWAGEFTSWLSTCRAQGDQEAAAGTPGRPPGPAPGRRSPGRSPARSAAWAATAAGRRPTWAAPRSCRRSASPGCR